MLDVYNVRKFLTLNARTGGKARDPLSVPNTWRTRLLESL